MSNLFDQLKFALPDRYELERLLGSGGMATVYLARDRQHGRRVAIKLLRPELAGAVGQDRFLREIRITSELTHPHILPMLDSGRVTLNGDSIPYYVMPYMEGESLRDRLVREKQLPIEDTIAIARDIAAALGYAHGHGIIHRDIKPENVLLTGHEAVVADFGIARAIDRSSDPETLTTRGVAIGTAAYMSPEQASAQAELDGRTDIYSLGCVVYEMLGGDPPFSGSSANAIAARHRVDAVPPLRTIRPTVPPALEAAVLRALEKIPADRFNTADQFAGALGHHHTVTAPTWVRLLSRRNKRPASAPPPVSAPRRAGTRLVLRVGAIAILVVGLLLIGWWAIGQTRGPRTTRYTESPAWSAWRGWTGEYFPLFAVSDSMLMTMTLGGRSVQLFDGRHWNTLAMPDSFQLLPHVGSIGGRRLMATKSVRGTSGQPYLQYWWISVSPAGLTPLEAIAGLVPDQGILPFWWSDGRDVVLWLDAIRKPSGADWVRELTGTDAIITSLWGPDVQHRFAIASPGDSLLVFDGANWKLVDILGSQPSSLPSYRAGATFTDGATVVIGDECANPERCRSLLLEQNGLGGQWLRVPIPVGVGMPVAFSADSAGQCDPGHFSLTNVAGRSREDYLVWGSWSTCDPAWRDRESIGCPPAQPCFWQVNDGKLEPVIDLLGKVVQAAVYMDTSAYALLDDGTLWRRIAGHWIAVTQVPGLSRMIGASPEMIVRLAGGDLRYEPGYGDAHSRWIVHPMGSLPADNKPGTPRRLLVQDSAAALLTTTGSVFVSRCRTERVAPLGTGSPGGALLCPAWTRLPAPPGRVNDIDFLADGRLIGVGSHGLVITWRGAVAGFETLPAGAREDSLWSIVALGAGRAMAIGSTTVIERDSTGSWTLVRRIWVQTPNPRFAVLADGDMVVVERASIQVWDRSNDSLPVKVLYRPNLTSPQVAAVHALPDGRLVAGFPNPEEPTLGGRLVVWAAPVRANRSQEVRLPIRVDVTDLADDGRYLYVVGHGGSLRIPLDSLPFSMTPAN